LSRARRQKRLQPLSPLRAGRRGVGRGLQKAIPGGGCLVPTFSRNLADDAGPADPCPAFVGICPALPRLGCGRARSSRPVAGSAAGPGPEADFVARRQMPQTTACLVMKEASKSMAATMLSKGPGLEPNQITIAITVYDRREFLAQAVESALNQTVPVKVM